MNDYIKGQEDLIEYIKDECLKILEDENGVDAMFDVISLLKNLKPKKNNSRI